MDLFRLLAFDPGRPVRTEAILDRLWPTVDRQRGRASLRTAASQIRRTVGIDCIHREFGGLVLEGAWVDVAAYRHLARRAQGCVEAGRFRQVVELADEAEALYLGDFQAYHDDSDWVMEARESLGMLRRTLLAEAADCAIRTHQARAAIRFANLAIQADPCSEAPHRSLMAAYAEVGETDRALRVYEHCRATLADELGADPSPQTRAVHVRVLRGVYGTDRWPEGSPAQKPTA